MLDVGLSKSDVRQASRRVGLVTAEKPAAACLASRFAYGVRVTAEGLGRIEAAEELLIARGFEVVRVRDLGTDRARIEVGSEQVSELMENAASIQRELKSFGFTDVELDPQGYRRGALNEGVTVSIGTPSRPDPSGGK
jgi:pyridinium-3,5-biscarboxylic acid mononucleotide sulfurtransferase